MLLHMDFPQPNTKYKHDAQLTCSSSWCSLAWTRPDKLPYCQGWDPAGARPQPLPCMRTQNQKFQDSRSPGITEDQRCLQRTTPAYLIPLSAHCPVPLYHSYRSPFCTLFEEDYGTRKKHSYTYYRHFSAEQWFNHHLLLPVWSNM